MSCGLNRMKHDFFKKIKITEKYPAAEFKYILNTRDASYKKIHTRTQIRYTNIYIYLSIKTSMLHVPSTTNQIFSSTSSTSLSPSTSPPSSIRMKYPTSRIYFFTYYQNAFLFLIDENFTIFHLNSLDILVPYSSSPISSTRLDTDN